MCKPTPSGQNNKCLTCVFGGAPWSFLAHVPDTAALYSSSETPCLLCHHSHRSQLCGGGEEKSKCEKTNKSIQEKKKKDLVLNF